ncbi:alpha/beta fold hydrolase [Bacillus sp. FJAT-45350]|uniref:alpha/beta fold hydrolase n=1 Tax=Bacillus sp. FJAT-45350 TaxID=2011014 RepID=UPI000BB898E6|nr:alpha/beta hydrolase [Bacillus sp. FJAT-45350]
MPFVKAGELDIHYSIEGTGEPLVLLHGLGNNSRSWKKQLEGLKEHFTVIAWDAPGYGASSDPTEEFQTFGQFAQVLHDFVEALPFESIYLLGHSMGSAIAVEFCSRYPDKVKALILASSTRGSYALTAEENKKKLEQRHQMIDTLPGVEIAKRRVPNLLSPYAPADVHKEAEEIMSQVRPAGYRSVANSLFHLNPNDMVKTIQAPTLVICGELDKVTPVSESEYFHQEISNSSMSIIKKTGHLCYQEDPEGFNRLIVHFLHKKQDALESSVK